MAKWYEKFEGIASGISKMDRPELIHRIKSFKGEFKLDFTDEYLDKLNIDRLRHILLALAAHISSEAIVGSKATDKFQKGGTQ